MRSYWIAEIDAERCRSRLEIAVRHQSGELVVQHILKWVENLDA